MNFKALFASMLLLAGISTSAYAQEDITFTPFLEGAMYFNYIGTTTHGTGQKTDSQNAFGYVMDDGSVIGFELEAGDLSATAAIQANSEFLSDLSLSYAIDDNQFLTIGQTTNLAWYNFGQTTNADNALIGYGATSDNGRPMIIWGGWGVNVAIISTGIEATGVDASVGFFGDNADLGGTGELTLTELPRFEVAYVVETDIFNGSVFGAYAPYPVNYTISAANTTGGLEDVEGSALINSFHVGVGGQLTFGDLFVDLTAYYGMNMDLTSTVETEGMTAALSVADDKLTIENVISYGGAIGVGYAVNEMITPSLGGGFASSVLETTTYNTWAVYANVAVQVFDWLEVVPEVAYTSDNVYSAGANSTTDNLYVSIKTGFAF